METDAKPKKKREPANAIQAVLNELERRIGSEVRVNTGRVVTQGTLLRILKGRYVSHIEVKSFATGRLSLHPINYSTISYGELP